MVDYKIVIPSYQRENLLKGKTLALLEKYNIAPERVFIFTASEEEKVKYETALADNPYGKNIILGVPTIGAQRNFIEQTFFNEGEYIVSLDDDLAGIYRLVDAKTLTDIDSFEEFILKGYDKMLEEKTKCWGIYAAGNPFFMQEMDEYTTDLCYIIASCYGFIVEKNDFLVRLTNHGEDYEYSIRQYIANKKIFRFNKITVKTKYFGTGGLEEFRNTQTIYDSLRKIEKTFPQFCSLYFRKNGRPELRLREKK